MALGDIPFYGAYLQRRQMQEQEQANQLGTAVKFATLQQHFADQETKRQAAERLRAFQTEIAAAPTPEAKRAVAMKYATPDSLIKATEPQAGFTIGDTRYDASGRPIVTNEKPAELKAPPSRTRLSGAEQVMEELQPDGTWKEVGRGPRFAPQATDKEPAPSLGQIVDPSDPKRMLLVNTRLYKGGSVGSPGVVGISGKEPTAAKNAEQVDSGRETVTSLITTLRDQYQQLQDAGGIVDPGKGTIPNVMAGIASSGPGQFLGRMTGTQNQSIRNQIAQQRPLLLQAIRKATGMTAKAMDSNVELKLYLTAATDPTLDIKANLAALDKLDELYGLSGQPKKDAPTPPTRPTAPGLPSAADIDAELARRRGRGR